MAPPQARCPTAVPRDGGSPRPLARPARPVRPPPPQAVGAAAPPLAPLRPAPPSSGRRTPPVAARGVRPPAGSPDRTAASPRPRSRAAIPALFSARLCSAGDGPPSCMLTLRRHFRESRGTGGCPVLFFGWVEGEKKSKKSRRLAAVPL
nr:atherin-like [Rattus norvegicus]